MSNIITDELLDQCMTAGLTATAEICPFDCDPCHGDECPCPQAGCAGEPE